MQTQIVYGSVGGFTDLYPTQVKTAYQTAVQRTETREYDFSTGVVTRVTDVDNNVATATTYDVLGRPTLVKVAEGKAEETRTATEYSDVNRRVIVRSDLDILGDGKLVSIKHYDQLGRIRLARQLEDAATQSTTDETTGIKVQTRYVMSNPCAPTNTVDCLVANSSGLGSYQLVSNAYRASTSSSAGSEPTMGWTRTRTNTGGRVVAAETFSGATLPGPWGGNSSSTGVVVTSYDANATTVTDQSNKVRRAITDGLGRLIRVDEPNSAGSLGSITSPNQATSYTYDALDDLTAVSQGAQTRQFVYSSLKRLTSANNPETGTINYGYDNSGNVTSKVDALSITTSFVYDSLNRLTSRTYSDSTPAVTYTYDTAAVANSKGRLTSVSSSISATNYTAYDVLGKVTTANQVTDGQTYSTSYLYNRAGVQTSLTYPSGRVILTEYDAGGRIAGVRDQQSGVYYAGAAGTDNTNRIKYAAQGSVSVMKLGNNLWEHTNFNSRLQSTEIGLGTSSSDSSTLRLTYNFGTTNNNGNVQTVSYLGGGLSYTQSFGYDELNRLTTSSESTGGWSQTNKYDRYGNRSIDLGGGNQSLYFNASNQITNSGYVFNGAGNVTSDGTQSLGYDAENKIKTVNGVADVFRYDGDGNRVRKNFTSGEKVRMVYSGGHLVAEYDLTTGALKKEYIYGAKGLVALIEPSTGVQYETADHLGTPRVITNAGAGVVSRHDYMPFGDELGSGVGGRTTGMGFSVSDGVRQKFTSKERDVEIGLDYFEARFYGYAQGRFFSCDPKAMGSRQLINPQRWNRYIYSLNSPLTVYDPDGQDDQGQGGAIVIDIYISHAEKGDELTSAQSQSLNKLIAAGAKKGITINLHDGFNATAEDADRSLAAEGNVVMFAGHTSRLQSPDGTQGQYLGFASDSGVLGGPGIIYTNENNELVKDDRQPTNASLVLALGCESSSLRGVAQGADNYIGASGQPSTYGQYNGIIAAVQTIVTSGQVNPEAVRAASESAIRNNPDQKQPDKGVRVILNPALNVPTLTEAHIRKRKVEEK